VPRKRYVNTTSDKEKKQFQKRPRCIAKDFTVAVEDESVFIRDTLIRKMWTPKGKHPIITVTGSHQRTCVIGTLTMDGKQLFRQYKTFDQYSFISYLRELKRKFHKLILFLESATTSSFPERKSIFGKK
jgi:DDE superfamily endonuclease